MNKSMKNDTEYKLKLEENFLKHIGYEHVDHICNEIEESKEQIEDICVPESLDLWFENYLKQELKKEKKRKFNKRILQYGKRVAVFFLLFILANTFLIIYVDAYRLHIYNTVIDIQETFTKIDFVSSDKKNENVPEEWNGTNYPSYIPEGYTLSLSESNSGMEFLVFQNSQGDLLTFQIMFNKQLSLQVDSESGNVSSIIIDEEEAVLVEKNDYKMVCWQKNGVIYYVETNKLELSELIKIANNIEVINKK